MVEGVFPTKAPSNSISAPDGLEVTEISAFVPSAGAT